MKSKHNVKQMTLEMFPEFFTMPTVLLFTRKGCHFCKKLKPIYQKISMMEKFSQVYDFYTVDADEESVLYFRFKADGVPTMYVLFEQDGLEIPYPENPPESGYGEEDIVKFLDELTEEK